jgi:anion-transporting  ArsA/GET3 family ATPase
VEARFFERRFIIVGGKGGVGKSTLSAAIGLAAARRGKRTLIAELDTSEKVPVLFGKPRSGYAIQQVHDNLFSINIQPEPALREYGLMKLRYKAAYKVVFENDFMRRLLRLIPGMNELLLIGKAWHLEQERRPNGAPVWDTIVVDAPATGHGVSLFRLPAVILSAVKSGPLADDTRQIRDLLTDPRRTSFHIVTLPEEMPYNETVELIRQTREVLRIPTGYVFVNQVWPRVVDPRDAELLEQFRADRLRPDPQTDAVLECARYMEARRSMQDEYLERIRTRIPLPRVEIPYVFAEDFGYDAVARIADHVEREVEGIGRARRD